MSLAMGLGKMGIGHALADGLQGRLSGLKRRRNKNGVSKPVINWLPWLALHGACHGVGTGLALMSWEAGLAEMCCHGLIDFGKGEGRYGTWVDQGLHVVCKFAWLALWAAKIM